MNSPDPLNFASEPSSPRKDYRRVSPVRNGLPVAKIVFGGLVLLATVGAAAYYALSRTAAMSESPEAAFNAYVADGEAGRHDRTWDRLEARTRDEMAAGLEKTIGVTDHPDFASCRGLKGKALYVAFSKKINEMAEVTGRGSSRAVGSTITGDRAEVTVESRAVDGTRSTAQWPMRREGGKWKVAIPTPAFAVPAVK